MVDMRVLATIGGKKFWQLREVSRISRTGRRWGL